MIDKLPIIGKLFDTIDEVIDRIVPDKNEAQRLKAAVRDQEHEQAMTDAAGRWAEAVELAKHPNFFVSGARPFGIWIINCALILTILFALYQEEWGGGATDFVQKLIQGELTAFGILYGIRGVEIFGGKARR